MSFLFKKISLAVIIAGVCMLMLNFLYGDASIDLIKMEQIENTNVYWYKIDMSDYILNIKNSFQEAIYFNIEPVPQTWIQDASFEEFANNNIPYIVNWASLILNILLIPIRIIFYLLKSILAFMGVRVLNTPEDNPLYWIIKICNWVIKKMEIPYIV